MKPATLIATVLFAATTAHAGERIVSFDHGSLDTLEELGLNEHIVALPKQALPEYLERYASADYADVGGLRTPDFEAIRDAEPSLILITGRQVEWQQTFEEIAPVLNTGLDGSDYLGAFNENVRDLAARLDAAAEAESALERLRVHIEHARETLAGTAPVLVATHNDGNLILSSHPVMYDVLGLTQPEIPDSVPSLERGSRIFRPLSAEAVAEMAPETLLIIDRSGAIGGDSVDLDTVRAAFAEAGAEETKLVVLSPALWYLSGGGLQSLSLQIDEVVTALQH
ncbi:ABC transporter substrate-binding protein [Alkalilimnicola ehrlichii]|uniref:ABC transporter substrate-binding protein n=1 Tax=Alkalilimnicola ehrlichii TaxID=351052 RepID=A0A3E0WT75_9GAMM|nr:ABC transporter substrate-binding protein [Alkalilimnicola ehrlichii]RFA36180.1 ABC transporter substrate-binding protein [Alkalilimnicola ehrlichii]